MNSPFEIPLNGEKIGKHPKEISVKEFNALGHHKEPLLIIIRKKCVECCVHQLGEVRKCVCHTCELWPYRMGTNPFRAEKTLSDKQKENLFKEQTHE